MVDYPCKQPDFIGAQSRVRSYDSETGQGVFEEITSLHSVVDMKEIPVSAESVLEGTLEEGIQADFDIVLDGDVPRAVNVRPPHRDRS